ncbi:protein FAM207A [Polypterus senegalus]|uniref:protein FAM207A n=1 Tax=Polypterus senegalus TaxID=55291 RepID=UPI0019639E21|nr:protein FAM207A [Polypterus senegalus]
MKKQGREATKKPVETLKEFMAKSGHCVYVTTVSQALHKCGFYRKVTRKTPLLEKGRFKSHPPSLTKTHLEDSGQVDKGVLIPNEIVYLWYWLFRTMYSQRSQLLYLRGNLIPEPLTHSSLMRFSLSEGVSPELDQMSIKQNYEAQERKQMKKKEKMKQRRDKWLNKINNIKLATQKQKEEAKRKKTPVVGDMQPLADALPELSQLITSSRQHSLQKIRKINVKKKPDPIDFSQMKPAQKRKFLDSEVSRFAEALSNSVVKSSRLAAIGDHLRKRLKQEEEEVVF